MSHTPGPWKLVFDADGAPGFIWGKTTCICDFGKDVPKPDDARLIAAAPELYERLNDFLINIERVACGGENAVKFRVEWIEDAKAALAKARGEEGEEDA